MVVHHTEKKAMTGKVSLVGSFDSITHDEMLCFRTFSKSIKWVKVFKNGPSKICGRYSLKNVK